MTAENTPLMNLLCVDVDGDIPAALQTVMARPDCSITRIARTAQAENDVLLDSIDAAVIAMPAGTNASEDSQTLEPLLAALKKHRIGTILIDPSTTVSQPLSQTDLSAALPVSTSSDELYGRLTTMSQYTAILRNVQHELDYVQRIGRKLTDHFTHTDEELRLANRLQHGFLPKRLPVVGPARFHVLYRPAGWVSGDIYDVFRLDETHVGFYIVDAVGHGVAAGLLTMFIRNALPTKIIDKNDYRLVRPAQALAALNVALAQQNLPGNQFVTACYCLLNTETLELTVARGGHPHPLRVMQDGSLAPVQTEGALLGIFDAEKFGQTTIRLEPGQKLFLFSDGLELAFHEKPDESTLTYPYERKLRDLALRPGADIVREFATSLDRQQGSINPRDDITLIVLDIAIR